jgi:hypothetical protein
VAFTAGHHFALAGLADLGALASAATVPLSVIVQVTKRCDFNCGFCSETLQMADLTLEQLDRIRASLAGSRCCAATCPRSWTCTRRSSSGCRPTRLVAWPWRRSWPGRSRAQLLAAAAWDCFPCLRPGDPAAAPGTRATTPGGLTATSGG